VVRLSKRVEYGLIAIRHIATRPFGELVTAKEIAEKYSIPYELLAKVLQKLSKSGLITSVHGVRGGYALGRRPELIRVSDIISAIEGAKPAITECLGDGGHTCDVFDVCTIKSPLGKVQSSIDRAFHAMTLSEIV